MSKPFSVGFTSAFLILFACSVTPAFAQRGGGGHMGGGGGFHGGGGGGGFHGGSGGGMRSNPGPGFSRGPASNPSAPSRPAASSPTRSGNQLGSRPGFASAARPNAGPSTQPNSGFARPGQQFGNSSAPAAVADGRWHSFGGSVAGQAQGAAASSAPTAPSNFHVFTGNRSMGSAGASRSFSGQGGEVWENAPAARNVVPRSQSLSTLHGSFRSPGQSSARNTLRPNSTLSASSTISGTSGMRSGQQFSNRPMAAASFQQQRGFNRTGWPFGRFGRGCWNCGFGFGGWGWGGFGFGWGWPGFGFWGWDPFWIDPWWGAPAVGYGYYVPPAYSLYASPYPYPDASNTAPYDYSNSPSMQNSEENPTEGDNSNNNGNWVTPNGPAASSTPSSPALTVPVLIYLKSGAVVSVRDYWMLDGQLHYILMNGRQNSVGLEQVDLPRTNTENAKSGVKFIFKSEPSVTAPPDPAPIQQPDAPSTPEAHT